MRPTPQSPSLGALASALRAVRSAGDVVDLPVLGGLGSLLMGRAPEEVEEWSYGNAPVRINPYAGRTASWVPEVKPGRAEQLADVVMLGADLAPLSRLAGRAASRGAMQAGRAGERLAERVVPGIMQQGGAGAEALRALSGGTRSQVIKPKGGNWLAGSVESELAPLIKSERTAMPLDEAELAAYKAQGYTKYDPETGLLSLPDPVNRWLDQKLARYIRNEMATPEDPLRLQAEAFAPRRAELLAAKDAQIAKAAADLERARAERGVTPEMLTSSQARLRELRRERAFIEAQRGLHFAPQNVFLPSDTAFARTAAGFPRHGMGKSQLATDWEVLADTALNAHDIPTPEAAQTAAELLGMPPGKTPPVGSYAYSLRTTYRPNIGFGHLTDELRNALNPGSGLPESLRITPERLEKLNVAQAAKLVDDINAWRAVQTAEANRARAGNVATHLFKEYPESGERGLRWVELKVPGPDMQGLKSEYMPEVDMWRIVDETGGVVSSGATEREALGLLKRKEREAALEDALKYEGEVMQHCVGGYCPDVVEGRSRIFSLRDAEGRPYTTIEVQPSRREGERAVDYRQLLPERYREKYGDDSDLGLSIVQIKGPRNLAPPEDVLPYVQDFVRSQKWGDVRDLQNTGLVEFTPQRQTIPRSLIGAVPRFEEAGIAPGYYPEDELLGLLRDWQTRSGRAPREGYAAGGLVKAYDAATIDRRAAELAAELQLQ